MSWDEKQLQEILDKLPALRKVGTPLLPGEHPPVIVYLKELEQEVRDEDDIIFVEHNLQIEYMRAGLDDDLEALFRKRILDQPDSPEPWISLAEHHWSYTGDLVKAQEAADTGLEKAQSRRIMVRHALNTKARIARKAERFEELETLLVEIMSYDPPQEKLDIGIESDFLHNLPEGAISQDVLDRYQEILDLIAALRQKRKPK